MSIWHRSNVKLNFETRKSAAIWISHPRAINVRLYVAVFGQIKNVDVRKKSVGRIEGSGPDPIHDFRVDRIPIFALRLSESDNRLGKEINQK